jgi:hypothetical protein
MQKSLKMNDLHSIEPVGSQTCPSQLETQESSARSTPSLLDLPLEIVQVILVFALYEPNGIIIPNPWPVRKGVYRLPNNFTPSLFRTCKLLSHEVVEPYFSTSVFVISAYRTIRGWKKWSDNMEANG